MQYPQYMLNPGDMFSVDLDKVLFATGAPKGLPKSRDPRWIARRKGKEAEGGEEAKEGEEAGEAEEAQGQAEGAPKEEGDAVKAARTNAADAAKTKAEAATTLASEGAEKEQEKQEFNRAQEEEGGLEWWKDANRDQKFDATKPYRTPWRPRYFLSAFAFIPKYLEVNHNIGHAVYLRHPVARPGQSEVCYV